jgi:hypothetical protein
MRSCRSRRAAGDGYVERDGEMVDPADVERRRRFSEGDLDMIRRRDTGVGSGA